jgi:hypothetical protein
LKILEAVGLGVDGAAVEEVAREAEVEVVPVPAELLEEGELVEELLGGVLVLAVARVDEAGARLSAELGVAAQVILEGAADALELGADHEGGAARVAREHLHRVDDGLVLVEGGGGRVEDVGPRPEELGGVPE